MKKNSFTIEAIKNQFRRLDYSADDWIFGEYSFLSPNIIKGSLKYTDYGGDTTVYTHYFFRTHPGHYIETSGAGCWWEWSNFWNSEEKERSMEPDEAFKLLKKKRVDITEYLFCEDEETRNAAAKILKKV